METETKKTILLTPRTREKPPILDFIRWALTHIDPDTLPRYRENRTYGLPLPYEECGTAPWAYLRGAKGEHTTRAFLAEAYERYKDELALHIYENAVAHLWPIDCAADSPGLLNAFLAERGLGSDLTVADMLELCPDRATARDTSRPFVMGEAVFMGGRSGPNHVGWICGRDSGQLLVVEAWNLWNGVALSRLDERPYTIRGLMTGLFDYGAAVPPEAEEADGVDEADEEDETTEE